jgi:D-alanyl-D-alanine carboxypeptidase (penicillin-binding protein 5/6)
MRLISVVLGAPTWKGREDASAALLNYGYTFYETVRVKARGERVLKPRLYKGEEEAVDLVPARDVYVTVGRGAAPALRTSATVREPLIAPLDARTTVGELTVTDGEEIIARVPLLPAKSMGAGGWWSSLTDSVALWFH